MSWHANRIDPGPCWKMQPWYLHHKSICMKHFEVCGWRMSDRLNPKTGSDALVLTQIGNHRTQAHSLFLHTLYTLHHIRHRNAASLFSTRGIYVQWCCSPTWSSNAQRHPLVISLPFWYLQIRRTIRSWRVLSWAKRSYHGLFTWSYLWEVGGDIFVCVYEIPIFDIFQSMTELTKGMVTKAEQEKVMDDEGYV